MTTTNPTALIASVTEVRPVRMYPGYMEDHSAQSKIGTVGRYLSGPDSDGDISVRFPDNTTWYVREWEVIAEPVPTEFTKSGATLLPSEIPGWVDGLRVRIAAHDSMAHLVGKEGVTATHGGLVTVFVEDGSESNYWANWTRLEVLTQEPTPVAGVERHITKADMDAWMPGIHVKIVDHPSARWRGRVGWTFGTNAVRANEDGTGWTSTDWVDLLVLDPEPGPVEVKDTPEVARLKAEVATLRKRESDLVVAMTEESQRRGWGDALMVVLRDTGLPYPEVESKVYLDVKRQVHGSEHYFTQDVKDRHQIAKGEGSTVHGHMTWTERVYVTLPGGWDEDANRCKCPNRHEIDEGQMADLRTKVHDKTGMAMGTVVDMTVIQTRCPFC